MEFLFIAIKPTQNSNLLIFFFHLSFVSENDLKSHLLTSFSIVEAQNMCFVNSEGLRDFSDLKI